MVMLAVAVVKLASAARNRLERSVANITADTTLSSVNLDDFVMADGGQSLEEGIKHGADQLQREMPSESFGLDMELDELRTHRDTILIGLLSGVGVVCCLLFIIWLCAKLHEHDRLKYQSLS